MGKYCFSECTSLAAIEISDKQWEKFGFMFRDTPYFQSLVSVGKEDSKEAFTRQIDHNRQSTPDKSRLEGYSIQYDEELAHLINGDKNKKSKGRCKLCCGELTVFGKCRVCKKKN